MMRVFAGLLALSFLLNYAFGQGVTTSGVNGTVTDKQGKPLAGATVTIVHEESGTTSTTVTRSNGQYNVTNLRPGGPYNVTVNASGYAADTQRGVFLETGQSTTADFAVGTGEVVKLEAFTVSGERDTTFGTNKIGPSTTLDAREIAEIPTVRRDIQDIAQLDSRLFLGSLDQGGQLSAQGQNFRFNSFLIDGVQAVDTFGLSSNGQSSLRSPIPYDAIQSFAIDLSPVDVRRGGFTGALLNAVIKSGTNTFHGSARYEYTGQNMRGPNPLTGAHEPFKETTQTYTLGGPIIPQKLFFFLTYEEWKRSSLPPQANFIPNATQLQTIVDRAKALGYDPGTLTAASNKSTQRTTIGKIDWNISDNQRLALTYRRNYGTLGTFPNFTNTFGTSLSEYWYQQPRKTDSYTAQLFSQWTPDFRTEATASVTRFNGSPVNNGAPFPQVQVQGVTGVRLDTGATINTGSVFMGTESSRQLNGLVTKETQGKFSGEYSVGDHTILAGGEEVSTKYRNSFIQFTDGYYTFKTIADWVAGTPPSAFQLAKPYAGASIEDAIAKWRYDAYAAYLQDTWRPAGKNLTVVAGLRLDYPYIGEKPPVAPGFATAGFTSGSGQAVTRNDTTNSGNWTLAPRAGFNYMFPNIRRTQLRGQIGLYQGKNPAVWISNAYSNAGSVYSYNASSAELKNITFNPDPATQTVPGSANPAPSINITDPKLVQPAVWKEAIALDHQLPFGNMQVSIEADAIQVYKALNTEFLNYKPIGTSPDGRQMYSTKVISSGSADLSGRRRVSAFADVYYLTNTSKGGGHDITLRVSRPFKNNWSWSASWTRSHYTEVTPMTSSVAGSNYSARAVFNPNEDVASKSNTNIPDRVVATLTRRFNFIHNAPTTISGIYQLRSGHPYSWVFAGDANGDGFTFNDLLYVPTGPNDPAVKWNSTSERDAFFAFVNSTDLKNYAGGHAPRNSETSPSVQTLDIKITQALPIFRRLKAEAYLNIINLGNMLNSNWGRLYEVPFSYKRAVAGATAFDPKANGGNGQWTYTFTQSTLNTVPVTVNEYPVSRWQLQVGVAIQF